LKTTDYLAVTASRKNTCVKTDRRAIAGRLFRKIKHGVDTYIHNDVTITIIYAYVNSISVCDLCYAQIMRKPGKQPIILISGSSGVGKNTILEKLVATYPQLEPAVSVSTRWPARQSERFGVDYYFVDDERYDWLLVTNQLIEHTQIYGHRYGTLHSELARICRYKKIPILEVDPAGIEHFADCEYDVHAVFLDFPNAAEQKRRLLEREPHISPEELDTRLSQAAQERAWALSQASAGHLIIAVNDKLGACVQEVSSALDILN